MDKWLADGFYLQGSSHIDDNIPCQDRISIYSEDECICIALSDGLGSKSSSHIGAEVITKAIAKKMVESFDDFCSLDADQISKEVCSFSLEVIQEYCLENNTPDIMQYACTLLAVVQRGKSAICCQIGDGIILGIASDLNKSDIIFYNHIDAEYTNYSHHILQENAYSYMQVKKINDIDTKGFLLTSDGMDSLLYNKKEERVTSTCIGWIKGLLYGNEKFDIKLNTIKMLVQNEIIQTSRSIDDCSLAVLLQKHQKMDWYCKCGTYNSNNSGECNQCQRLFLETYTDNIDDIIKNVNQIVKNNKLKDKPKDRTNRNKTKLFNINKYMIMIVLIVFLSVITFIGINTLKFYNRKSNEVDSVIENCEIDFSTIRIDAAFLFPDDLFDDEGFVQITEKIIALSSDEMSRDFVNILDNIRTQTNTKLVYDDQIYIGMIDNSKKNGYGVEFDNQSSIFWGHWTNNERDFSGVRITNESIEFIIYNDNGNEVVVEEHLLVHEIQEYNFMTDKPFDNGN